MFGMSAWHLTVLVLVGLFVFGPERLPNLLRDLGKALRQVRRTAQNMQEDLQAELGPEVGDLDLRSLHPRTFVEKHLFGDEEDPLGLDFLTKEPSAPTASVDAQPGVSFDKAESPAEPPGHQPAIYEPAIQTSGAVKYDEDAT